MKNSWKKLNQTKTTLPKLIMLWIVFFIISGLTILYLSTLWPHNSKINIVMWFTLIFSMLTFIMPSGLFLYFKDTNKSKEFIEQFQNLRGKWFTIMVFIYGFSSLLALFGKF